MLAALTNIRAQGRSVNQIQGIEHYIESILSSLDEQALRELSGGSESDLDDVLSTLYTEVDSVLFSGANSFNISNFSQLEKFAESTTETLRTLSFAYFIMDTLPSFDMGMHHIEWTQLAQIYQKLGILAARDHCFGKGTKVRMFDGSVKEIQEIQPGDVVMGPDSKPRNVLSCHTGFAQLYDVVGADGVRYTASPNHQIVFWEDSDSYNLTTVGELWNQSRDRGWRRSFDFRSAIRQKDNKGNLHFVSFVEQNRYDRYYGFECDGDHLFLLENGLIVHNSKSYVFSFAYLLWQMYRYRESVAGEPVARDISLAREGMLITNEFGLGITHLTRVKEEIENNDILREKLLPQRKDSWGKEALKAKNKAQVYVKSYGSRMRGFHPTYAVVDDFLDETNLYSEDQRQKYISYFYSVIENAVVPGGAIRVIGTPFAETDLYGKLKTDKSWKMFEYPAIFPDGRVLFPERYNFAALMAKRQSLGNIIFSRELLVKPVVSESTIFPYDLIRTAFRGMEEYTLVDNIASFPRKMVRTCLACDFARSGNIAADYSIFGVVGKCEQGMYWLLHLYRGKGLSYNQQLSMIKKIHLNFNCDIIAMEDNVMQSLFVDGAKEANLPVVGFTTGTNKYDLRNGVPGMTIVFEQGRFRFPRGNQQSIDMTDILAAELSSITWTNSGLKGVGAHDDTVMFLWKALQGLNYITKTVSFGFL